MNELKIIYSRHNKYKPALKINSHQISFNELTLVFKGPITYYADDKEYVLNDGDGILIPINSIRERKSTSYAVDYISFNYTGLDDISLPIILKNILSNDIRSLIRLYDEINELNYLDNSMQLTLIFRCLMLQLKSNLMMISTNKTVLKIKKFLLNNLSEKISLDDIGNLTHFSPIYCDVLFKKECNCSIIEYYINEKIKKAKIMIIESCLSLVEVAHRLGFDDYNYFSRLFKKKTGYTPTQYKKLNIKK